MKKRGKLRKYFIFRKKRVRDAIIHEMILPRRPYKDKK